MGNGEVVVDTDWWHNRQALAQHGIQIVFLCPQLMEESG